VCVKSPSVPTAMWTLLFFLFLSPCVAFRGPARFFLDTADRAELSELLPLGIFHGVTTNPTILQRCGVPCTLEAIGELSELCFRLGAKEFMCQSWGGTAKRYYETGTQLRELDSERMVIKLPVSAAGVEAAARLTEKGTRICLTAGYSSKQALLAGNAGVEYLAPYLGRMTDSGKDGFAEVERMHTIARGLGCGTRILVASIRDVEDISKLACRGLDTFTFSPSVARALFADPLTERASEEFESAAAESAIPSVGYAMGGVTLYH
jgi:transaldolase